MKLNLFLTLLITVALLSPVAILSQQRKLPDSTPLPRANWLQNGLIDAGGSHEPYLFVVRRGGQHLQAYEHYQKAQSQNLIRRLKDQGIEVFHTHLYKGFGMAAERPEMEDAKRVAEIAHRYGLKVDSYIQWNTMMYETFFVEEPRAKNWIQRDALGKPILLVYGYQQSFRYRPCFANQEYLDYLKKIVRYAVEDVKTDFIHFDNFDLNPEPDSCHCQTCVRRFREFLKTKYSPEKRKERFGFENVDYVNPPLWNMQNPPEKMEIIFDPAIQEWIDFRCQIMADALHQMAAYAKSMNSEVAIEVNPHGITGENRAWGAGLDHARFLKSTEVFWTEEENEPAYLDDGRLISKIRSYKLARSFNNILLTYIANNPVAMAECLSFNQTIGFAGEDPLPADMLRYLAFYKKNRELYTGSEEIATVALLRSYPSITYHNARAQLDAILMEQTLIQSHIPFNLIFDEHLSNLSKYEVLVLPDSECLSDSQLTAIRQFVENGGGLVVSGATGMYDEWRRLRTRPGLESLVDFQKRAEAYQERVEGEEDSPSIPVRKDYGKGRVIYFPSIVFDAPLPEMEPYFSISNRFWRRPKNWSEITEGVRWAAKGDIPIQIDGLPFLVANLVEQLEKNRMILHLINYDARKVPSLRSVGIKCQLPQGKILKEARLISPDSPGIEALQATNHTSSVELTLPEVKTYAVLVLSW